VTGSTALGPGAEFDAIRMMLARWGDRAAGVGDDAACLHVPRGDTLVVSVDSTVETTHFERGWLSMREIGFRATVAALSDLAAMAATPLGILNALILPVELRGALAEIADGVGEAAALAGVRIVGGNISNGPTFSITSTVLGSAFAPLARSGARDGDLVYVTGALGGPLTALRALQASEKLVAHRDRFARPMPRLAESRWLAERGATAAIDISDGLVADLRHLAAASGRSLAIDGERVPRLAGVGVETSLESGEEYEVVVTMPHAIDVAEFEGRFSLRLTCIGRVESERGGTVTVDGSRVANVGGHDHFSR
jgi:thiamine-monophosphate kinase